MEIKVYRFGEWERTRNRFYGLAFKMQQAMGWATGQEAEAMARRIKNNIYTQAYVGDGHPPDAESTLARKAAEGKDERTLIEDGEYVRAIEAIKLGRYEWGVGVRDPRLAEIGNVLEWGGHTPKGATIPARPVYRPEMERTRGLAPGDRLPIIATAMARVLGGDFD